MHQPSYPTRFLLALPVLVSLLFLTACRAGTAQPAVPTQPPVQVTSTIPATSAPALPTEAGTATLAPSQTSAPTQTLAPSSTLLPPTATAAPTLGFADTAISGWCVPPDALLPDTADPTTTSAGAKVGKLNGSTFEINNLPSNGCVFMYTFNQPAPQGLKLAVYDLLQKKPWLEADLKPVPGQPNSAAVVLRHSYIIAPPLWKVSYRFAVSDTSGKELRTDQVALNRWTPRVCWNGQPPNVYTLRCPLAQDLHPWDPSYLTPIPTGLPPEYWQVNP